MNRHENLRTQRAFEDLTAVGEHSDLRSEKRTYRRCPEAHDDRWRDKANLAQQPIEASGDFLLGWSLVHSALASQLPAEMLHCVRDVNSGAVDPCLAQCALEQASGWTHKWLARQIFPIARLLADEHDPRVGTAFTAYRLCCSVPQRTTATVAYAFGELRQEPRFGG